MASVAFAAGATALAGAQVLPLQAVYAATALIGVGCAVTVGFSLLPAVLVLASLVFLRGYRLDEHTPQEEP